MKKNFTLIELLVVIAIIAILAGLVMPALGHAQAKGRTTECINNKKQIMTVLRMYGNDHSSMIPYWINIAGTMRPYSWILGGCGSDNYSKEMITRKSLVCNTANNKELIYNSNSDPNDEATNATGMLDVDFGPNSGTWYESNKARVGRFVAKNGARNADDVSIAYVLEKMKNPSDMLLLADAFRLDSDQESPFWTFTPLRKQPRANGNTDIGSSEGTMIGVPHVGSSVVAYADGRAEAVTLEQLRSASHSLGGVTHYFDVNFKAFPED